MTTLTLQQIIRDKIQEAGGLRRYATMCGVDKSLLVKYLNGERDRPTRRTQIKLGILEHRTYSHDTTQS